MINDSYGNCDFQYFATKHSLKTCDFPLACSNAGPNLLDFRRSLLRNTDTAVLNCNFRKDGGKTELYKLEFHKAGASY